MKSITPLQNHSVGKYWSKILIIYAFTYVYTAFRYPWYTWHAFSHSQENYTKYISYGTNMIHDDVIKWRHFPRYWPFVRRIHRSPVNSPHKGQWRGALMFTLICARIKGWVNNCEAGDLRRNRAHYDVIVMFCYILRALVFAVPKMPLCNFNSKRECYYYAQISTQSDICIDICCSVLKLI